MQVTLSQVREWPRLIAAGLALAVLLVLVGVLLAMAGSSSDTSSRGSASAAASVTAGHPSAATQKALARLHGVNAAQAVQLRDDARMIAHLRGTATANGARAAGAHRQLAATKRALAVTRARTQCWRARALHLKTRPNAKCAVIR